MNPAMTQREVDLLRSFLSCSSVYLEFGAGGSTCLAAGIVKEKVIAVDSSQAWLDRVAEACALAASPVKPTLHFADIGPVRDWGYPTDAAARARWPDYYSSVWTILPAEGGADPDLYLIDGRFRVACFVMSLLHCRPDAVLMIHDFNSRPEYHVVRQLARQISGVDDLAIFLPDPKVERQSIMSLRERYSHVPD